MARNPKSPGSTGSNINSKTKNSVHPTKPKNKSSEKSKNYNGNPKSRTNSKSSKSTNNVNYSNTNRKTKKLNNQSDIQPKLGKKARNKKNKKSMKAGESDESIPTLTNKKRSNSFGALEDIDDDDELFNVSSASEDGSGNIVLLDSADEDEDESTSESNSVESKDDDDTPPTKKQKIDKESNSLTENSDFIAFDDSSDDDREEKNKKFDYDNFDNENSSYESDGNEYLSNDETGYHTKSTAHKAGESNSKYPWIRNNDHSKQIEISDWLTMEIKDFINYMSPSADEIKARNQLVKNLRESVTSMWPDAELHCFGSFATDLYLPGSDIDMVVVSKKRNGKYDNKSSLYQLSSYLRTRKLGINIQPIAKAKVPIIKFVDPKTGIHIDISFERTNGVKAAELIVSWIKNTPGLRELVLIVKQFLAIRKLNVVHTGGLGGFAIICLVRSFLQLHPRVMTGSIDPIDNLGVLLIEFFELYGYNFGYDNTCIAFNDKGDSIYVSKSTNPALQGRNPFLLAIQDPHDSSNNISRSTYNLRDVKRAFGGAFELLTNKCYEMYNATYKERLGQSVLGDIIKYKGAQRDFEDARDVVKNHAFAGHKKESESEVSDLPPLPSDKSGRKLHEDFQFYSDMSDSEDDGTMQAIYDKSQSSTKPKNDNSAKINEMMGIKLDEEDEDEDDAYEPVGIKSDGSDSETYLPKLSRNSSQVSAVEKVKKREFWLQKGSTF